MEQVFLEFQLPNGTSWFYLSFLLMIAIYFRFARFFSLRNWDVITLFLFVPGLLAVTQGTQTLLGNETPVVSPVAKTAPAVTTAAGSDNDTLITASQAVLMLHAGYVWLFCVTGYFLFRSLIDLAMVRRPRLDPNLNMSGLAFLAIALAGFMIYEILIKDPDPSGKASARVASERLQGAYQGMDGEDRALHPAIPILMSPMVAGVQTVADQMPGEQPLPQSDLEIGVARGATIGCHVLILLALVLIGWQHYDNMLTGMGMVTLYLLLPLTALNVEKIDHLLPSVFLVWAIYFYRWPSISGSLMALAGLFFFPLFLLPLWFGFYGRKGFRSFIIGFGTVTVLLWLTIWWLDPLRSFMEVWTSSVAWQAWDIQNSPESLGFWTPSTHIFRLPIFVVFVAFCTATAFWPKEKTLADLIALSVALILGMQFWYADRGGTYIHWYLPLLLLMIFRPNLQAALPFQQEGAAEPTN